jgi:hypothetical protein
MGFTSGRRARNTRNFVHRVRNSKFRFAHAGEAKAATGNDRFDMFRQVDDLAPGLVADLDRLQKEKPAAARSLSLYFVLPLD